jgi:hypothetical protein
MEKLICNKNLALSAKAPLFFEQSVQRFQGTGPRMRNEGHLQQQAFSLPLLDGWWAENCLDSIIKHCLETLL